MAFDTHLPTPLVVNGLTRRFGARTVVENVAFSIAPGQVTCLLGPSGCGKSTTLRMIAGVEEPNAGRIALGSRVLWDEGRGLAPEHRGIGLMFQDFALFPHLDVAQNVSFALKGRLNRDAARARVEELLDRVGMARHIDSYPHQLSGGEQQRVALARALAPRPRVMLMDEPFSGLDDRLRDGIRDETLAILKSEGTAVLLVTHEPAEAMRMADEILLMRDGRIVQNGTPYQIFNRPVDLAAAAFFSDVNVINGKVEGGSVNTPFGAFPAPDQPDGTLAEVVIRPQHMKIDFDREGRGPLTTPQDGKAARGIVLRSRFMGSESLVEFCMEHDGSVLKATVPSVFLPRAGKPLWLMFRRDRCFVFPAGPTTAAH